MRRLFVALWCLALVVMPRPGWCGPDELRGLIADLERARKVLGSISLGWPASDNLPAILAKAPPEPGWRDVETPSNPAYGKVSDLLELMTAARDLGFLERRDATARKVLWEIAGRARLAAADCDVWNARFRRLTVPVRDLPKVRASLDGLDASVAGGVAVVERARRVLEAEALAGGPPPEGRPLLAERSEAYARLLQRLDVLDGEARELIARHGAAIEYDWPARITYVRRWARRREDVLGMILAAGLTKDSHRHALEFAEFFTKEAGWLFEGLMESVCRPSGCKPQIPKMEQPIASDACDMIDAFWDSIFGLNYDLNATLKAFIGRE